MRARSALLIGAFLFAGSSQALARDVTRHSKPFRVKEGVAQCMAVNASDSPIYVEVAFGASPDLEVCVDLEPNRICESRAAATSAFNTACSAEVSGAKKKKGNCPGCRLARGRGLRGGAIF